MAWSPIKGRTAQPNRGTIAWYFITKGITDEFIRKCNDGLSNEELRQWCISKGIPKDHVPASFKNTRRIFDCRAKHGGARKTKRQPSVIYVRGGVHI